MEEANYEITEISISELIGIAFKHAKLLLLVFGVVILLFLLYIIGFNDRSYTATTKVSVESLRNLTAWEGQKTDTKDISFEVQFLKTQDTIIHALNSLDLSKYRGKDGTDYQDLLTDNKKLAALIEAITISEIKGTNSLTISIKHSDPVFSQDFLSALVSAYNNSLLDFATIQLTIDHKSLQTRIYDSQNRLDVAKKSLNTFQKETDIIVLEANRYIYQRILTLIQLEKSGITPEYSSAELNLYLGSLGFSKEMIENKLQQYGRIFRTYLYDFISDLLVIDNTSNTEMETRNPVLAQAVVSMELAMTDWLLSIGMAGTEAANLSLQIGNTIKHAILSEEESYYFSQVQSYASLEQEYSKLKDDVARETNENIQLINQLRKFEAFSAMEKNPTIIISDIKFINAEGESGNLSILLVGIIFGLFLALVIVFFVEYFSDFIDDKQVLQRAVGKVSPLLSIIPIGSKDSSTELEVLKHPESATSTAYSRLAGILLSSGEKNVFTISSLGYGEGTHYTVLNTALSLLKSGKRVLLLTASNESVQYQRLYAKIKSYNEVTGLVKMVSFDFAHSTKLSDGLEGLYINTMDVVANELSQILHSQEFLDYVKYASSNFDIVLIVGPSFKTPNDLLAVARITGGVILNVRASVGSRKQLRAFINTLELCKVPVLGTIYNNIAGKPSRKQLKTFSAYNREIQALQIGANTQLVTDVNIDISSI